MGLGFRFVVIYLVDLGFAQQLCVCVFFGVGHGGSVVGLRHGGCESMVGGVWWVCWGWGVVSRGSAMVGYGLWVLFGCCCCCCVRVCVIFFGVMVAWFLWPVSSGFCGQCLVVCVCVFFSFSFFGGGSCR